MTRHADTELCARTLAKTLQYLDFPAVVGFETPFLDHVAQDFQAAGFKAERCRNLAVIDLGKPGPVFLAHGDRHGLVSAAHGALYAAYAVKNTKYGDQSRPSAAFIETLHERHRGEEVFAYDPKTGGRLAYGDIVGVAPDEEGRPRFELTGLPPLEAGTPLGFSRSLDRSQAGYVSGQIDNPASIAALRVAAEFGLGGTVIITAEEEIGRSAAHVLTWAEAGALPPTRALIVCDTSPFDDGAACLSGAVILRRRDASASFDEDAVAQLESAAAKAGAPVIFKDSYLDRENEARARRGEPLKSMGLTELGQIIAQSKGAYTGATLQIPTFNYHTNRESTTPRALSAVLRTLLAL